jgi:hypothetical protein
MSDTEEPPKKRKASEKQLEGLRKGMAVLKAKREALAKEKDEIKTKIEKGELPEDTPIPKAKHKPRTTLVHKPLKVETPAPEPTVQPVKKPRKKHVSRVAEQFDAFKQEMLQMVQKPAEVKTEVVEKVVEKPIEKIIQKERVITGSEMLNKIFNL